MLEYFNNIKNYVHMYISTAAMRHLLNDKYLSPPWITKIDRRASGGKFMVKYDGLHTTVS